VVGVAVASGCRSSDPSGASPPEAAREASMVTVTTPEGLVLEVALHDPDAMWARVQRGAGGAFALLPPTMGAIASAWLGTDGDVAANVDGQATSYAALVQRGQGGAASVAWALAMPLAGAAPAASGGADAATSFVWSRQDGWLLVASDASALASVGPFVRLRLPSDTALASSKALSAIVPAAAMRGAIASDASDRWASTRAWLGERARVEREEHGGRAPDFGDPEAIVATADALVAAGLSGLTHAGDVRLDAEAGDDDVTLDVRTLLPPGAGDDGASSLGDTRPLNDVSGDAAFALLLRGGLESRVARAHELASALARMLGVAPDDTSGGAMASAFEGWARSTGDWLTVSEAGGARGLSLRTPAGASPEGEAASRHAVHDVLALLRLPPLRALLRGVLGLRPVGFKDGAVSEATFGASGASVTPAPGVAWTVDAGQLAIAVGADPRALLVASRHAPGTLGIGAWRARMLSEVGDGVAFALWAEPLRFGRLGGAAPEAPLVVAGGVRSGSAWARVDLSDAILTEGVRLGGGLF
jgi:hypothetical protein